MGGPLKIDGEEAPETDNFLPCRFEINDKKYCSAENYFQSMKTTNNHDHEKVRISGPGEEAWEAGSKVTLRPDWDRVKVRIMYEANLNKFSQNEDLRQFLVKTTGKFTSDEGFWGEWNPLIMTRVRAQLRQNGEEDEQTAKAIAVQMSNYELQIK